MDTDGKSNVALVAPLIPAPFRRHKYRSDCDPVAVTERDVDSPCATTTPRGCSVITGNPPPGGFTVSVSIAVTVLSALPLSDAVRRTAKTPSIVGDPVIRPTVGLIDKPDGRFDAENRFAASGPVVTRYKNGTPFVAVAVVGLVIRVEAPETAL